MSSEPAASPMGIVAQTAEIASGLVIVSMVVIVAAEVIARNFFAFSFQISEEYGGYLIAILSVLSLASCQAQHAFHRVEIVQSRVSPRMRSASRFVFDLISIGFALVMAWQFTRMFFQSWRSGDVAPSLIETPYWIPQLFMPIGAVALLVPLCRSCLRHFRAMFRPGAV